MVRFSWHVEDGLNAYLPPGAYTHHKENSIRQAACEIENGKDILEAVFTLPANYLDAEQIKETGIILGHGSNASEWKGKLLSDIATFLAMQGFLVLRYHCPHKEGKRQRMFEKSLDACATSPFARGVSQWVLAGVGSGARVAAAVGAQCRGQIAGFVFMAYPLKEPLPAPTKARRGEGEDDLPSFRTSGEPLQKLQQPILFLMGDSDSFCPLGEMRSTLLDLTSQDVRLDVFEDANEDFKTAQGRGPAASLVRRLCSDILDFVSSLEEGNLKKCQVLKATEILGLKERVAIEERPVQATRDPMSSAAPQAPVTDLSNGIVRPQPSSEMPRSSNTQPSGLARMSQALREPLSATHSRQAVPRQEQLPNQAQGVPNGRQTGTAQTVANSQAMFRPTMVQQTPATAAVPSPQLQPGHAPARAVLQPAASQNPPAPTAALQNPTGSAPGQAAPGAQNLGYGQPASLQQLPQLYQQLSQHMLGNSQQAQQLFRALAAQQQQQQQQQQSYQQQGRGAWPQYYAQQQPSARPAQAHQQQQTASIQPHVPPDAVTALQQLMSQQVSAQQGQPTATTQHPSIQGPQQVGVQSSAQQQVAAAQMLHTSSMPASNGQQERR